MFRNISAALLAAAVLLPPAQAQMRGAISGASARGGSFTGAIISANQVHGAFAEPSGIRHFYPPLLLGSPYYYADFTSQPVVTEASPQVVVIEMPAPSATEAPKETTAEPLLIEWQGNRYVRIGGSQVEDKTAVQADYSERALAGSVEIAKRVNRAQPPAPEPQPAVLVYRDGHREQVREYTIADGILYASGQYWTDGYWTKKIQLNSLDLLATTQASQERGVKFVLPHSTNEVVTGP